MSRAASFRVPVARDPRGRLVAPEDADKRSAYACPACGAPVDLHAGAKKQRHFHHRAGASPCSSESAAHVAAKELIVAAVRA